MGPRGVLLHATLESFKGPLDCTGTHTFTACKTDDLPDLSLSAGLETAVGVELPSSSLGRRPANSSHS